MKFKIETSGTFYNKEQSEKLKKLGFEFRNSKSFPETPFYLDTKLEANELIELELDTLEELLKFEKEWGPLIIDQGTIEIYDDYRE